jgi:outer membrane protein
MKTIPASTVLTRRPMTSAALWLPLILLACSGWAQSQPDDLSLTLTDAVTLALKQNPDVQVANLALASKQQEKAIARSELLPHVNVEASESITRFNLKALVGVQIPEVPHNIGPYQVIHAGPSFSTPIFDLTLLRSYEASKHRIDASLQDTHSVREQTTLLTISEYAAHLRAVASVHAAESRVELATRLLTQAKALKDDGVASKIDVERADVRLSEEKQRLIDARAEEQTTIFALKRILSVPDSTRLRFSDEDSFFSTPPLDISEPVQTALRERPELLSLAATQKAAEDDRKAAAAASLPKLSFTGRWDQEGGTLTTLAPGYDYSFNFKLPLFTGGRLKAERETARIALQKTQVQLTDARNRVIEQTRQGQVELRAALDQTEVAKRQVSLASDELVLAQDRFRTGVTDNIEVVAAQDSLARANDAQIAALFRYSIARAQLARAVGAVERTYVP